MHIDFYGDNKKKNTTENISNNNVFAFYLFMQRFGTMASASCVINDNRVKTIFLLRFYSPVIYYDIDQRQSDRHT